MFIKNIKKIAPALFFIVIVNLLPSNAEDLTDKQTDFLNKLNDQLNLSKADYRSLSNSVKDTEQILSQVSEEKTTLAVQLANIQKMAAASSARVAAIQKKIIEQENFIILINEDIEIKKIALIAEKENLKNYVKALYLEEKNIFLIDNEGKLDALKLLLDDQTVAENLREYAYFEVLNAITQTMIERLNNLTRALNHQQQKLQKDRNELAILKSEFQQEEAQLLLQKNSRENLLKMTLGQEEIYAQLLEQSENEEGAVLEEIRNLNNAFIFIEEKIRTEGKDFDPAKYAGLLDARTQAYYDFQLNANIVGKGDFAWPVEPKRGISAYFREAAYKGTFGVQHNAIDLPIYQGSPVRAAADAIVYSAKDNGYGYSYIILAHSGGFRTVYGHVSSILVKNGQKVPKGSIIALSGGMPGTLGAGYMTTGPHLHFEMLKDNNYVDPLDLLDLSIFTSEQALKLPEKYRDDWQRDALFDDNPLLQKLK